MGCHDVCIVVFRMSIAAQPLGSTRVVVFPCRPGRPESAFLGTPHRLSGATVGTSRCRALLPRVPVPALNALQPATMGEEEAPIAIGSLVAAYVDDTALVAKSYREADVLKQGQQIYPSPEQT